MDDTLMRTTEFFQPVPRFFLAILVVALFGNTLVNLVGVLAMTSWAGSLASSGQRFSRCASAILFAVPVPLA
jgi:ABC-type dipeptide/oligopeptide/nickel transport system permease subunit